MAAITNLVIKNAALVDKTFAIQSGQQGNTLPASWLEKTSEYFAGYVKLTSLLRRAPKASKHIVSLKLAMPKLAIVGIAGNGSQPSPSASSVGYATVEFHIPDNFGATERADLVAYAANALTFALVKNQVVNFEPIF